MGRGMFAPWRGEGERMAVLEEGGWGGGEVWGGAEFSAV